MEREKSEKRERCVCFPFSFVFFFSLFLLEVPFLTPPSFFSPPLLPLLHINKKNKQKKPTTGEDLAPHLLQRAPRRARGAPGPADRGAAQPQGQPREDDADHVRDLQRAGDVSVILRSRRRRKRKRENEREKEEEEKTHSFLSTLDVEKIKKPDFAMTFQQKKNSIGTSPSRPCSPCTPPAAPRASCSTRATASPTRCRSTRGTRCRTLSRASTLPGAT